MEFLSGLLTGILRALGFYNREATVVLLGLDNAGKSSLQHRLKTGSMMSFVPTQKPREEEVVIGGLTVRAWDMGGHKGVRRLWKKYYSAADGVVFMVDSGDTKRLPEARAMLKELLDDKDLADTPIAILANKSEKKTALKVPALREGLGLPKLYDADRKIKIFRTSVSKGYGYEDGFRWIADHL